MQRSLHQYTWVNDNNLPSVAPLLTKAKKLLFDFEYNCRDPKLPIYLVQICTPDREIFLMDILQREVRRYFESLMSNSTIEQFVWDDRMDMKVLKQNNIRFDKLTDIQPLGHQRPGMSAYGLQLGLTIIVHHEIDVKQRMKQGVVAFDERPLPQDLLEYVVSGMEALHSIARATKRI